MGGCSAPEQVFRGVAGPSLLPLEGQLIFSCLVMCYLLAVEPVLADARDQANNCPGLS